MRKKKGFGKGMGILALAVAVFILFSGVGVAAGTVHNNNTGIDYDTIQAAIDAASAGDEIHVDSGTYYENVNVNKQLKIIGENSNSVIVIANDENKSTFEVRADWVIISGFTVRHVTKISAGIHLNNTNRSNISNNIVLNNHVGIMIYKSRENVVTNNDVSHNHYGIPISGSNNNTIRNNTLTSNTYYYPPTYGNTGMGISIYDSSDNSLKNNSISHNDYGIYITNSPNGSHNNILSTNNFIENSVQAHDYYSDNS
jgi:parallel beta-helix repeat protein